MSCFCQQRFPYISGSRESSVCERTIASPPSRRSAHSFLFGRSPPKWSRQAFSSIAPPTRWMFLPMRRVGFLPGFGGLAFSDPRKKQTLRHGGIHPYPNPSRRAELAAMSMWPKGPGVENRAGVSAKWDRGRGDEPCRLSVSRCGIVGGDSSGPHKRHGWIRCGGSRS